MGIVDFDVAWLDLWVIGVRIFSLLRYSLRGGGGGGGAMWPGGGSEWGSRGSGGSAQ